MVQIPLIKDTLAFYYELNSDSHGYKHLDEVYELAIRIRDELKLEISNHVIMCAAYTHDMFSSINREHHHVLAQKYVADTNVYFLNELSTVERHLVSCAVGEHRASFKGQYTSVLSELISAADRGIPDSSKIIRRVYQCAMEPDSVFKYDDEELIKEHGLTHEIALTRTVKHLKDKYATNGYARYNSVYEEMFGEELTSLRNTFDDINESIIHDILEADKWFQATYSRGNETYQETIDRISKAHGDS